MLTELKQKPVHIRKRISLYSTLAISLLIFSGWFYSKGFLANSSSNEVVAMAEESRDPSVVSSSKVNSPLDNIFSQFSEQYNNLKDSIASVMVPFITGIDVYEKSK